MFDGETLTFPSDDEVEDFKKPTEDVTAEVVIRKEKDRELGDWRNGVSDYGPWVILPFEVVEGEFKGTFCSMMLSVDPTKKQFRHVFQTATGIDISGGGSIDLAELKKGLLSGRFTAIVGPDKKKPDEYTRVSRLLERVGDNASAGTDGEAPAIADDEGDDDLPF